MAAKHDALRDVINESASRLFKSGAIDQTAYDGILGRDMADEQRAIEIPVPTGEDIKAMREKANLSQALFARKLHLSTGYVSQLERGVRQPSGPTLVLLDLIRKRGIEVIQ
jgi:putative transcriptional regulator